MTTEDQRKEMISLSNKGMKAPQIANQIGCSVWTVRKWIQRLKKKQFSIHNGSSQICTSWEFQ